MIIHVELFGIPRHVIGRSQVDVEVSLHAPTLADVIAALAECFPDFAEKCVGEYGLAATCVANFGGDRFVRDPATLVPVASSVLIMSADAGG